MKTTMVIPSYWARESSLGTKKTDVIYDHPTPLDEQGTLKKTLESLSVLNDKDFDLVVIAVANSEDIRERVEKKVSHIISSTPCAVKVHLFGQSHLNQIHKAIQNAGGERFVELLKLQGYSNIRSMCLFLPHLLGSDIAVLIDDDEVFEDPDFMRKSREFIGDTFEDVFIGAVAGFYLQPDGDWLVKREKSPWMKHWDKFDKMNEAFEKIIGKGPRLKETPFVFGGNMVIHRDIFKRIPFDPVVTRGEDIDFLINIKMFGYKFYLDNTLAIKHLPPSKSHPIWKQLREDIYRFTLERAKLRDQEPVENMIHVSAEELDPYPGAFLKDDLEDKIEKTCTILADQYLADNKRADATETLKNIDIANRSVPPGENVFHRFIRIKKLWEEMMEFVARQDMREKLKSFFTVS
ncbi:MAG TPA: hypothetical protein DDW42_10135 [Desulfobacteraceae bacterium]|nr:hypothetical protein [Desulfobacteraceae bacterium]